MNFFRTTLFSQLIYGLRRSVPGDLFEKEDKDLFWGNPVEPDVQRFIDVSVLYPIGKAWNQLQDNEIRLAGEREFKPLTAIQYPLAQGVSVKSLFDEPSVDDPSRPPGL